MNKKIIYSLVLTSIFLVSTVAVCIQPVAGASFRFGVPEAAKGMKLQSEVKVYDKSVWGDCLGTCVDDSVNEKYGGDGSDANNVGARSQGEISDWERDDIWFFGDFLMENDVPVRCDGSKVSFAGVTLSNYWSAAVTLEEVLRELGTLNATRYSPAYFQWPAGHGKVGTLEALIALGITQMNPTVNIGMLFAGDPNTLGTNANIWNAAMAATTLFEQSTYTRAEIGALYSKTYRGTILTRDSWDFAVDLESDPDEEDMEAPFIEDPEDLYDSYLYFNGFLKDAFGLVDAMINSLVYLNKSIAVAQTTNPVSWNWIQNVVSGAIQTMVGGPLSANWAGLVASGMTAKCVDLFIDALLVPDGTHPLQAGSPGLMYIVPFFLDETPQQDKEYLAMLLDGGIPASQPVDKWLERLLDAFSINDEEWFGDNWIYYDDITLMYVILPTFVTTVVNGIPVTDDLSTGGITVDGLVVTVDVEWPEGFINNKGDGTEERDDYSIVYTYGDTGGQSKTEYYSGDTLFYEIEGISPTIIGYEVSILLGAAAIATLGLIFVVIKKRRM